MTDSMDDEQRGRREQSLPQAPASGSGSPPLKKKARGSGTNQSVPLKSGASISCNSSDSSRYGTTAAQALSERQGSAPADNEKPRRKRSLAATSSAAHTPTLHIGVGILDLETSRVRVYSDEDIVHVYNNGWFGVSSLQEVVRTRRPLVLWQKPDFKAANAKGRKAFSLQGEHLELTLEEAFFAAFEAGVLQIYTCATSDGPVSCDCAGGGAGDTVRNHRQATFAGSGEVSETNAEPGKATTPTGSPAGDKQWATTTIPASIVPGEMLDASAAWKIFVRRVPSFALRYMAYSRLRSDGWVPMPGISYGCDYTLYPGDPSRVHAAAALLVDCRIDDGSELYASQLPTVSGSSLAANASNAPFQHVSGLVTDREILFQSEWRFIQSAVRIATATKKKVLVCSVRHVPSSWEEAARFRSRVCIIEFVRMERLASNKPIVAMTNS